MVSISDIGPAAPGIPIILDVVSQEKVTAHSPLGPVLDPPFRSSSKLRPGTKHLPIDNASDVARFRNIQKALT